MHPRCIKHTYTTVSNAYKDSKPSPHSFVGVVWQTEKVCTKCGAMLLEGVSKK